MIFAASFLGLILLGSLLLTLPSATTSGHISFIDALFTATSAVCVTGLAVLDTQNDFTITGQWIIILLVQLGGLGMMTFTSFFAFIFRGESNSFQIQLMFRDTTLVSRLGNAFQTITSIIIVTLFIEAIGALLILHTIKDLDYFVDNAQKVHFAIFHSISSFCNAGFSTLSGSLETDGFINLYQLHWIIAGLFIALYFNYRSRISLSTGN